MLMFYEPSMAPSAWAKSTGCFRASSIVCCRQCPQISRSFSCLMVEEATKSLHPTWSVRTFTFHPCCQFCPVQYFVIIDLFNWMLPLWRRPEGSGCDLRWEDQWLVNVRKPNDWPARPSSGLVGGWLGFSVPLGWLLVPWCYWLHPGVKGLVGLLLRPRYSWAFMAQINVPPTPPAIWKDFLCAVTQV